MVLATVQSSGGMYAAQIALSQPGDLSIKILFADGSAATGSVVVR